MTRSSSTRRPRRGRAGASTLEVQSGGAANLQVGTLWARSLTGLVLAEQVEPKTLVRGTATEVVVMGEGLDQVSGVRVYNEMDASELTAQVEGTTPDGGLRVKIDAPASAPDGPWDLQLLTPQGPAPAVPDAQPRLWIGRARIQADSTVDLGDVPVGQSVPVSVQLTNPSSDPYMLSSYQWSVFQGGVSIDQNLTVSPVAPGASGTLSLNVTPTRLGPTVMAFNWLEGGDLDAVTEVRFWGIPPPSGN